MYKRYVHAKKQDGNIIYDTEIKLPILEDSDCLEEGQLGKNDALATYSFIQIELSKVLGKVLTLMDASISEPKQNKAIKDLIKTVFAEEYGFVSDMLHDQKAIEKSINLAWDNGTIATVDQDTALGLN